MFAVSPTEIPVQSDDRVELVSLVFYLAGTPGCKGSLIPEYQKDIETAFRKYENHAAVDMARKLTRDYSVSYDAVGQFAFYLNNATELKWMTEPKMQLQLDSRWPREQIPAFLESLRDFSKKSRFSTFAVRHRSLYQTWCDLIRKKTLSCNIASWVGQFFGTCETPSFKIVPSFLTGGFSYGITVSNEKKRHCIMIAATDPRVLNQRQDMAFELSVVHEFAHAYINPFVDSCFTQIESSLQYVFTTEKEKMCAMAYGSPKIMITETFVRAVTALYAMEKYGDQVAVSLLDEEQMRGFVLIQPVFDSLKKARTDGGKQWTFHQSHPEYISAVNRAASARKLNAPNVIGTYPQNGAVDVDPALTLITFTFDQPMKQSYSLCRSPSETLLFPELNGTPSFDVANKKISVPVRLKPGKPYLIFLNTIQFKGFMSEHNIALPSYAYTFSTRK